MRFEYVKFDEIFNIIILILCIQKITAQTVKPKIKSLKTKEEAKLSAKNVAMLSVVVNWILLPNGIIMQLKIK